MQKITEKLVENIDGQDVLVRHLFFTVSNILSLSRIPAAGFLVYLHSLDYVAWSWGIFACIFYIIVSDFVDGWMARWLNQISELGKSIDPLADKIAAFILFVYVVKLGLIPLWFVWFFMFRDGCILIGSTIIKFKYGKVAMSVMSGKIAVNVLALYWMAVFFYSNEVHIHEYLLWGTVVIMVYSFFDYMIRFFRIIQGARFN